MNRRIKPCSNDIITDIKLRIDDTAVPDTTRITGRKSSVHIWKRFFPIQAIRRIITIDDVTSILNHECETCQLHLEGIHAAHPSQYPAEWILETDEALSLFALLVYLQYPLLIGTFLISYGYRSLPLPRHFSSFDLGDRQFQHLPERDRYRLADEFQTLKFRFSAPVFETPGFQKYEEGTILPFLDEEPIGGGGYGKVYKVTISDGYCLLNGSHSGPKIYARKEIIGEDAIEFLREKTALERIASLQDPHLVKIQKTYQLGNKFNILFHHAKTNLQDYLRSDKFHPPRSERINKNPLWEQVLGITKGLSKIITFVDPERPGHSFFGYHLDLKPQNILVFHSGSRDILQITDFGQTQFVDSVVAGTSRIDGNGGTDAYAPPEYFGQKNSRYDVWSLGIIILEILVFAVRGRNGLLDPTTGLDYVRRSNEDGPENSRFYTGQGADVKVKTSILNLMASILTDPSLHDEESRIFAKDLMELVLKMLEPRKETRISIDDALLGMGNIFQMKFHEDSELNSDSLKEGDEVTVVDEKLVQYYPRGLRGHSLQLPFIILEDSHELLRIWVGREVANAAYKREDMKMIMNFQHKKHDSDDFFEISLAHMRPESAISLQGKSIVVDTIEAASRLQIALIGHELLQRFPLESVVLEEHLRRTKQFKALIGKISTKHQTERAQDWNSCGVAQCIELWLEKPRQTPMVSSASSQVSGATNKQRRANRRLYPGKLVPLGRVVVYFEDRILILPFTREGRLRRQDDMSQQRRRNILFQPMNPKEREYFEGSWLYSSQNFSTGATSLPGVPLSHFNLSEAEKEAKVMYKSIDIRFQRHEDAFTFYTSYRREKGKWLDATKLD